MKATFIALTLAATLSAAYVAVPPGPPPNGTTHPFVQTDGDLTCDQPLVWRDNRGWWHSQCDQSHSDPYNTPSHVRQPDGSVLYMGPGMGADNNYHRDRPN